MKREYPKMLYRVGEKTAVSVAHDGKHLEYVRAKDAEHQKELEKDGWHEGLDAPKPKAKPKKLAPLKADKDGLDEA